VKIPATLKIVFPYRFGHLFEKRWHYVNRWALICITESEDSDELIAYTAGDYADRLHCIAYNMTELRRATNLTMGQLQNLFVRALLFPSREEALAAKSRLKRDAVREEQAGN
jgi:hypothetical protein